MADPIISIHVTGMDKIEAKLKLLPDAVADAGIEAADNYLLRAIIDKEFPAQKSVTRKQAYGQTFQSDRQRRWFFAALHDERIKVPYSRTSPGVQGSWKIEGHGRNSLLTNDSPAAEWVYSEHQARLNQLVGWRRVSQIIDKYTKNIVAAFDRAVVKAIKKVGLS